MPDAVGDSVEAVLNKLVEESAAAAIHCLAAAERAVEDGRFNMAKVLRALAHAARLRALAAARVLALDRQPAELLASSRALIEQQSSDREKVRALAAEYSANTAIRRLSGLLQASAELEDVLVRARRSLESNRDILESDVAQSLWGCHGCGAIVEGALPGVCSHCGAFAFEFEWFGPFYSATYERLGRRSPSEIREIVADSPRRLDTLLEHVSEHRLARRPSADEWCMKEIAGHLVDVTELFSWRVTTILSGATPPSFDGLPPPWRLLEGKGYPAAETRGIAEGFRAATQKALSLIDNFDAAAWGRYGFIRGRASTILDFGIWLANHNVAHLAQIAALREAPPSIAGQ